MSFEEEQQIRAELAIAAIEGNQHARKRLQAMNRRDWGADIRAAYPMDPAKAERVIKNGGYDPQGDMPPGC